jgi:Cu/Ag efflux pump CusA
MIVNELYSPTPQAFRSEKEDHTSLQITDTRKNRITLHRLNRLRVMNDARKLEHEKKLETISIQYKPPAAPAGPGL